MNSLAVPIGRDLVTPARTVPAGASGIGGRDASDADLHNDAFRIGLAAKGAFDMGDRRLPDI